MTTSGFRIEGINHVGLAPKDPEKARWFLREVLGLSFLGEELVKDQKTNTIMFTALPEGASAAQDRLEILAPEGGTEGPIAKFLEKKGSGIHHIALSVDSVDSALAHLKAKGVRLVDETPRPGAHQTRIAFVHPEATGGLLIELVEEHP
jgi:methylmalonyl-CoA/ethylmalonyl-CoA epimerase